ncbi:MAG: hypothetical protein HOQ10_04135 [Frateuria sp.]|uniref:hypothetical protein n=1 Tax=Frateuria sp. TaxID=2211372 RepID=UPI0017C23783|nr:hypothetical protein [Frateuria sp.]NUO71890.1 hypothetical protein [Frateuria sp.]NUR23607.1 hypothetical protein [Frateuria sp.]
MADAIEMLETIGRSASLRHASAEELTHILERELAPEALVAAVTQEDSSLLHAMLGSRLNQVPQVVQTPGREEEEPEPEDEEDPLTSVIPSRPK